MGLQEGFRLATNVQWGIEYFAEGQASGFAVYFQKVNSSPGTCLAFTVWAVAVMAL